MAFQKNISIYDGQIDVQNSYLKITSIQIVTRGEINIANVTISAFKDRESATRNTRSLESYSSSFTPIFGDGLKDVKAQAYEALKQEDFF